MASALEKLMKGTIQKSDAQKAFSPWWETLEDKLLYSLMILGMITLPFNMVSNTPVECTLDQRHPSFENLSMVDTQPMRYHHFYLRKYCTMNFIHDTMVFLPFILILAPLPLVGIGQMCLRYFRVQKRIDAFYKLLVKDSLDREDVEAMEKEKAKNSHEVWQMFRDSNGIYYSFIAKALIQLVFGGTIALLLLWIRFFGLSGEDIKCRVFTQHYVCVVPLASFYASIVIVANMSTIGFLCCSLFTLLWMLFPRLSPFHRFMQQSYEHVDRAIKLEKNEQLPRQFTLALPIADNAEPFFDVFFDRGSRDLGLLITLLAACNGNAEGLRFVALFDKDYQKLWKPLQINVYHDEKEDQVVHVEWNDAPIAAFINNYRGRTGPMRVEYTLEISPPCSEAPLKSHVYRRHFSSTTSSASLKEPVKEPLMSASYKYKDTFYGVEMERPKQSQPPSGGGAPQRPRLVHQPVSVRTLSGSEYFCSEEKSSSKSKSDVKVIISCEVNGRTIAQRTEKVPPPPIVVLGSPMSKNNFFSLDEEALVETKS